MACKFKALLSPTQMFSVGNNNYQFVNGIFETDDEEVSNFLKNNFAAELIEEPEIKNKKEKK